MRTDFKVDLENAVNVARESTSGHYLTNCNVQEFGSEGTYVCTVKDNQDTAVLQTKNHGEVAVKSKNGFAVFTQVELNNFSQVFERARD
jgi:hypothetical protein